MTCRYGHLDGAYLLGALGPAERSEYEAHLAGCPECAAAVARLAPVPGLLGRVDPAAMVPDAPAPPPLSRLVAAVTAQRRRRRRAQRWRLAGAAVAAAVLAVAGSTLWGLADQEPAGPDPAVVAAEMEPVAEAVPVTAQVRVAPAAGGTEVWMACQYPHSPSAYGEHASTFRLVAIGMDGSSEQVGSWRAAPGHEVTVTGMTQFPDAELARLELRSAAGTPLLAYDRS